MLLQNTLNAIDNVKLLIKQLLEGIISPSEFRYYIKDYSKNMVVSLFRDSFPYFSANIRNIITELFQDYFFDTYDDTKSYLMEYVDDKEFFTELKIFHDEIYEKGMNIRTLEEFYRKKHENSKLRFSYLEKQLLLKIEKSIVENVDLSYNIIAKELKTTQKSITKTLQRLNSKGIYLGGEIDWNKIGFKEYFILDADDNPNNDDIVWEKYQLFPYMDMTHIVSKRNRQNNVTYSVKSKITRISIRALINYISLSQFRYYNKTGTYFGKADKNSRRNMALNLNKYPYAVQLLLNCKEDYKHPRYNKITDMYTVSTRTLIRLKSKLISNNVIKPHIIIANNNFVELIVISQDQPIKLLQQVPLSITYKVVAPRREELWISKLSIWRNDLETAAKIINEDKTMYIIIKSLKYDNNVLSLRDNKK